MTGSFLEDSLRHVRADSASPEYERGVPAAGPALRPSLREAIARSAAAGALVVEYKRASPGSAVPLPAPRTVEEFVAGSASEVVSAYSCLATTFGFDGAPARVAELVGRTAKPVLFKEFVVGPRQIDVAARTGAAAILLLARLEGTGLLEVPLSELAGLARRRGLEVLLEFHAPAELSRAPDVEADVYGVNVRDLSTLAIDRPTAWSTLELAARRGLRPLLGLSGVGSPADAREFWTRGCDGILVGSAVARSADPERFLRSLRRRGEGPS